MSKQLLIAQQDGTRQGIARGRKIVAALLLAAMLTGLPVLASNLPTPISSFLAPTVQAGCPSGGTCG